MFLSWALFIAAEVLLVADPVGAKGPRCGCTKWKGSGYHSGTHKHTYAASDAPDKKEWKWRECAHACAEYHGCDFWTLQLTRHKQCILMSRKGVYHDDIYPHHASGAKNPQCLQQASTWTKLSNPGWCNEGFLGIMKAHSLAACQNLCITKESCKHVSYKARGSGSWCMVYSTCNPQKMVVEDVGASEYDTWSKEVAELGDKVRFGDDALPGTGIVTPSRTTCSKYIITETDKNQSVPMSSVTAVLTKAPVLDLGDIVVTRDEIDRTFPNLDIAEGVKGVVTSCAEKKFDCTIVFTNLPSKPPTEIHVHVRDFHKLEFVKKAEVLKVGDKVLIITNKWSYGKRHSGKIGEIASVGAHGKYGVRFPNDSQIHTYDRYEVTKDLPDGGRRLSAVDGVLTVVV